MYEVRKGGFGWIRLAACVGQEALSASEVELAGVWCWGSCGLVGEGVGALVVDLVAVAERAGPDEHAGPGLSGVPAAVGLGPVLAPR